VLPTGTNKVKFTAKTAYGNNFYADNVKVGPAPVSLQPFTLNSPANNATLVVAGSAQSQININWRKSATGATYQWRAFLPGGSVNSPILTLPSNNSGADTVLTVTVGQVDAILASLGVNIGDTATIQWSVRAKLGTDSLFATTPYTLNLVRNGVASLQVVAAPQTNNATTQVRAPNGTATATYMRAATIVTAAEYANAGITANNNLRSMGFRFSAPSTGVMTGIMKIYLQNTTDATYSKGTAWTGITPGMTLVFDDTVTVAQGALVYDMEFTNQFVYSGSQVYVAYDWQMLSTAIPAQTYFANNVIAASLVSASSATAPPPTLGATAFRPELRWGVDRLPNDLEVLAIWAKGKNPLNFGAPEAIQAVVRNNGYLLASKSVSLNISGANTFTATANVSLASSQLDTITFAGFNPSNIGYNNITVSVPADDKTSNDSRSWAQLSTNDVYGYADSVLTGLSGVGYNTGGGLLLSRFEVNGVRSISGVNVHISSATTNVGNTVYAVVLDTAGNIVGQSANLVIANGDLNTWKNFLIPTNPVISNQPFYVGLAQVANAVTGYFPVSFQSENPTRPNAFFSATLTGATIAPVNGFRLMIEAVVTAPPTCPAPTNVVDVAGCTDASISWTSSAAMLKSKIEYGPAGFTPGSGTVVNNVTSPYTITGLSLNTSYDVYVTDSCQSGWSQAVGASLTTLNVPVASGSFTTTNGITFTFDGSASTGNPTSYSWNFGDGNTGSGVSVNHTYASSGTYTVTLIVVNDCGSDTATFPVTVQSIDQFGMGSVSLYPNPNTGLFQIIGLPVDGGDILVEVMSTTGAVVYRATVEQGNDVKEVDMRGYGPGVYQVRMTNNKGFGVMPFVLRN
jgi:hypothetical protein